MLGRRAFAGAALAGLALPALRPARASEGASPERLGFEVVRHGSVIGTHVLRFERQGGALAVHIDVELKVGFGPITFFRYRHQGVERWEDGRFASLETQTDNDGEAMAVSARRRGDGVEIRTAHGATRLAPAASLPLTHWNMACMSVPLFNPQDGEMLAETARLAGQETVALADGRLVAATHYAMSGKAPIDDWYDREQTWTALRAQVKDGSVLEYRRTA